MAEGATAKTPPPHIGQLRCRLFGVAAPVWRNSSRKPRSGRSSACTTTRPSQPLPTNPSIAEDFVDINVEDLKQKIPSIEGYEIYKRSAGKIIQEEEAHDTIDNVKTKEQMMNSSQTLYVRNSASPRRGNAVRANLGEVRTKAIVGSRGEILEIQGDAAREKRVSNNRTSIKISDEERLDNSEKVRKRPYLTCGDHWGSSCEDVPHQDARPPRDSMMGRTEKVAEEYIMKRDDGRSETTKMQDEATLQASSKRSKQRDNARKQMLSQQICQNSERAVSEEGRSNGDREQSEQGVHQWNGKEIGEKEEDTTSDTSYDNNTTLLERLPKQGGKTKDGSILENKLRHADSHQNIRDDPYEYPWFAPRVILNWIKGVWRHGDAWEHWTIDNYDAVDTYREWNLEMFQRFAKDQEARADRFHQMRHDLIQVECEIWGVVDKDVEGKQETKERSRSTIQEVIMQYHKENINLDGREGTNGDCDNLEPVSHVEAQSTVQSKCPPWGTANDNNHRSGEEDG